jgi:hypothetical protein
MKVAPTWRSRAHAIARRQLGIATWASGVAREAEPYFRLHRGQCQYHRNCSQNTEQTFFDLADEYGMVNDFWASTQDQTRSHRHSAVPDNARDTIVRLRNHPSIVCGAGAMKVPSPILERRPDRGHQQE